MIALSPRQPYPGLRPFDLGDEAYFFGRDAQIRGLRQKLSSSRLVAVVGRSGCGKSSLVRAGLIPLLHRGEGTGGAERWHIATFRPQGRPIKELAAELLRLKTEAGRGIAEADSAALALRQSRMDAMLRRDSFGLVAAAGELGLSGTAGLLIMVDQFEEIFRFEGARGSDADEATAFVRLLLAAVGAESPRISVILTMRLDFLGDCARFQGLPEAISDGQFLVPNLNRAERRAAIEEPAKKCGAVMSAAVTQRLLNETGEDPDMLPVLQHALMRTWQQAQRRHAAVALEGRDITLDDYKNTGGIADAISRHADEVFDKLPDDEHRRIAERMFKAISELSRGRAIRRTPPLSAGEIADIAATDLRSLKDLIEDFRAPECCFLMPPVPIRLDASTPIDISHESLLRRWTRMRGTPLQEGWLAEEERDGKTYRSLLDAAETFATDDSAVLPPTQTRQRRAWWTKTKPNAAWAGRYGGKFALVERFLGESEQHERTQRRRRVALVTLATVVIGASLLTAAAVEVVRLNQALELAKERQEIIILNRQTTEAAEAQAAARQQEVDELRAENDQLREQLRARGVATKPDEIAQQTVQADPKQVNTVTAVTDQHGYMWIGSVQQSNLQTASGASVSPTDVHVGERYRVVSNTYLRQGLPDEETYAQKPSVGILSEGALIEALAQPRPYQRRTGDQYWMPVRIVASARLPTVYLQFAGALRSQAQALSKLLQGMGYKMPGEERVEAAQGKREVRYFYQQDQAAAQKLAEGTTKALATAGYPAGPPIDVRSLVNFTGKKNSPGVVELWLDLPLRAEK